MRRVAEGTVGVLCLALAAAGCRSGAPAAVPVEAHRARPASACSFAFSSLRRPATLRTRRDARPFAQLVDDAAWVDGRASVDSDDPGQATVVLNGLALSLEGRMGTDNVPLYPARPLRFEGVVVASSAAEVRARAWLPGGRVVVELPEVRFVTPHAPLRSTVRCRDLRAELGEGSSRNADAGVWLSGGPPVPFARSPGGPPVVSLRSWCDNWDGAVRVVRAKERWAEIVLRLEAAHSLKGWVPAGRVVIRPTDLPVEGERGEGASRHRPMHVWSSGEAARTDLPITWPLPGLGAPGRHGPTRPRRQPFAETRCKGGLALHARIGRDVLRVGRVKPGAAMVLDPEVLGGWRVTYLEEPWFGLERGVELVVSARDLAAAGCREP